MKQIFAALFTCAVVVSLVFLGAAIAAEEEHEGHAMPMKVELTGEVIDVACYSAHPDVGQGAGHLKCAETCTKNGLPVGLLEKDTEKVYLAVMATHQAANDTLLPYLAKQVTLKGTLHATKGVAVVHIDSVELVK